MVYRIWGEKTSKKGLNNKAKRCFNIINQSSITDEKCHGTIVLNIYKIQKNYIRGR